MKYVALCYASNTCYTKIVEASEAKVDIDCDSWYYEGRKYRLNTARYIEYGSRYGVIAVVDVSTIEGLNHLLHLAQAAVSTPCYCD